MAEFPAIPLFTDAYLADTRHLTAAQHGAYLLLLMMAWRTPDCCLPDDDEKLARWACMDRRTWQRNKAEVMAFWRRNKSGQWEQGRLVDERKYVSDISNKQSANARSRWLKTKETGDATAMPNLCQTDAPTPTPTPTDISSSEDISPPLPPTPDALVMFEDFWTRYPHKVGKKAARKAYNSARKETDHETIVRGLERYLAANPWRGELRYCKHPATWLNACGWLDEYPASGEQREPTRPSRNGQSSYERGIMASLAGAKNPDDKF